MTLERYRKLYPYSHGNLCYNCAKLCDYDKSRQHSEQCGDFVEGNNKVTKNSNIAGAVKLAKEYYESSLGEAHLELNRLTKYY